MDKRYHAPYIAFKLALAGKGLTYGDVAKVIGKSTTAVQLKINGQSDFFLSEQQAICKAFDLDSSIFFDDFVA